MSKKMTGTLTAITKILSRCFPAKKVWRVKKIQRAKVKNTAMKIILETQKG